MTTEAQVQGLGLFGQRGFTLERDGTMAVFLLHEGKRVARFMQTGATPEILQEECARHLALRHHWNGCIWSRRGGDAKSK